MKRSTVVLAALVLAVLIAVAGYVVEAMRVSGAVRLNLDGGTAAAELAGL